MAKVLLVEDNTIQAKAATKVLKDAGHRVTLAPDGKSAIKNAATSEFDLVLLDLVLPDMQGNQICQWLKSNETTRRVPIIMLTSNISVDGRVIGLEAGADDYIEKPYHTSEFNARINACLRAKRLQDELSAKNAELQNLLAEVERLAITDHLTGLFNRRHFTTMLMREYNATKRYKHQLTCFMIDIDRFKSINDEFGHQCGDVVLKEVATLLTKTLRKVDMLARWGGEEFVALLPQTGEEAAIDAGERLLSAISSHTFKVLAKRKVTISIGSCTVPEKSIGGAEALVNAADRALYMAKGNGRNRLELFKDYNSSKRESAKK